MTLTELRYYPYGDTRYNGGGQKTNYRPSTRLRMHFTGQRWDQGHGLYWFNSRWFDPLVGRFLQADSIVPQPGNPQALNRYSYVLGNPLRYTDPTGHQAWVQSIRFPGQSLVGALAIGAEAIDPMPFDPVVIPFGVMLIANDPLWQIYGPQLPALFDKAVEASHSLGRALQGGNTAGPGGLGPNDPWDRFSELIKQGVDPVEAAVRASTQGSGDRFVIGSYHAPAGTLNYIDEATQHGGKYFNAGTKLWGEIAQKSLTEQVNRQVIYDQMKAGIGRIDISSGMTIKQILDDPTRFESLALEVGWIEEFAQIFGYVRNAAGTGWIKP